MKHSGLTMREVHRRQQEDGPNCLKAQAQRSMAALFFSQFKDLMILILTVATIVSLLMGERTEAIAIIAIVLLNAVMGFLQEYRTEKTLNALQEMTAPVARVIREGSMIEIPAVQVVRDDIAVLHPGDRVPADGVLLDSHDLSVDESLLTGESQCVAKQAGNAIYMGTGISGGTGVMHVSGIGMDTEMGSIAGLLEQTKEEKTPLQKRLTQLGKTVAAACLLICVAVSLIGWMRGAPFLEMLLTGISLAVAAIPEGMPAIVTIVLALSVDRILKKGAIIRKFPAVETLGCAGVICTDKTGTVTQNRMIVKVLVSASAQYQERDGAFFCGEKAVCGSANSVLEKLARCAVLCNNATLEQGPDGWLTQGDATEAALLLAAARLGVLPQAAARQYSRLEELPFSSQRKRMSVIVRSVAGKCNLLLCKGAPDLLVGCCTQCLTNDGEKPMTGSLRGRLMNDCTALAANAYRVLAFAESSRPQNGERGLTFLGFAALLDPPKPKVSSAVRRCRRAGMKPVMITGDYEQTAVAIATQVGIFEEGDRALSGARLQEMSDEQLAQCCMSVSVYSRVTPQHKLRIVRAYQACGQVVAMTGDGVNDAPAMKQADIGVAMNSGTDVTKEAGDVVILDNDFTTIVCAVEEGRIIYQNIRRFIRYLLTGNLGEVLSMLFSMLLGLPTALIPIQILMVNLLTDGLPAIALGLEPPDEKIMQSPPRPKQESLFAQGLLRMILLRGVFLGVSTAGVYYAVWRLGAPLAVSRSAAFLTMVLAQMVHIFECRGRGLRIGGNPTLLVAVSISILVTLGSVYLPPAQAVFHTVAVTGGPLLAVIIGVFLGPLITALLRTIKHCFEHMFA